MVIQICLFDDVPVISFRRNIDRDSDGVVALQHVYLTVLILLFDGDFVDQPGIIKRYPDLFSDRDVEWVVDGDKSFLLQSRVDVHDTVPVLSVGTAKVDDVGVEYPAILFIEGNPFVDQFFSGVGIIQTGTAVAGCTPAPNRLRRRVS